MEDPRSLNQVIHVDHVGQLGAISLGDLGHALEQSRAALLAQQENACATIELVANHHNPVCRSSGCAAMATVVAVDGKVAVRNDGLGLSSHAIPPHGAQGSIPWRVSQ